MLIAGGGSVTTASCLDSAELYDPVGGTFSPTGSMTAMRCSLWWRDAPVLSNGKVLIAGGLILDSAELFDPATATFSSTGTMTTPRAAPTVTLLTNGQVLVAGGATAGGPVTTNSAELYDPASGVFTATASMATARQQHTATLLVNGQVLVTGGFNPTDLELSSVELFSLPPVAITVAIDIKPGSFPNSINPLSRGQIPVAILSTPTFDAPVVVNEMSLTFGRTGSEASLTFCDRSAEDVNGDGLPDLVCHFTTQLTGFQPGDTKGILKGQLTSGVTIVGSDSVRIVPPQ